MQIKIGQRVKLNRSAKIQAYAKKHNVSELEAYKDHRWIAETNQILVDGTLGTIKKREIGKSGFYMAYVDFDNHTPYKDYVCAIGREGENLPDYLLPLTIKKN